MQVKVDREGCIGCGLCTEVCPEVFRLDEEGLSAVIAAPTADNAAAVQDAADGCPVSVIHITE